MFQLRCDQAADREGDALTRLTRPTHEAAAMLRAKRVVHVKDGDSSIEADGTKASREMYNPAKNVAVV